MQNTLLKLICQVAKVGNLPIAEANGGKSSSGSCSLFPLPLPIPTPQPIIGSILEDDMAELSAGKSSSWKFAGALSGIKPNGIWGSVVGAGAVT